jgi:hypothetical protein
MIVRCLAILCTAVSASATTPVCTQNGITSGGDVLVTGFIAASLPRVHEAVADAMQAAGVSLFRNTDQSVEGERAQDRIIALGLGPGDEAVRSDLTPSTQGAKAGTQVRVETLHGGNKKGLPKHMWSKAVLDQTACLVSMLSLDDPLRRPNLPAADGAEFRIPDSTSLPVRSRHFFFTSDTRPNHIIPFETAEDLVIDGSIVIPAGSLVAAMMDQATDVKEFGRAAKGQLQFKYLVLPDGTRIPLRGIVDLKGRRVNKGEIVAIGVIIGAASAASVTGSGFAIPAGALFHAEVDGQEKIRVKR